MYLPPHFEETRPEVLQQIIREYPLGTLVTLGSDGLAANHVPFEYDPQPAPLGTLRCHVARGNSVWKDFDKETPVLVIFGGPQAYISPNWYETKREHGKVVPTYNYVVVHAYGSMRVIEDAQWLHGLVSRLTERFEAVRPQPWAVSDAPHDYIEKQLGAIVGIEIAVARLIGKAKASQNRSVEDQAGVIHGLRDDDPRDAMAEWMEGRRGTSSK
jgi:transcriptional regulator